MSGRLKMKKLQAFLRGAGSIMNLFPTREDISRHYNPNLPPKVQDVLAIAGDWQAVGDDIRAAMKKIDYKIQQEKKDYKPKND